MKKYYSNKIDMYEQKEYDKYENEWENNASQSQQFMYNGTKMPAPPKPGEIMVCQFCGKPIMPNELSKNKTMRKREIKWHLHPECVIEMERRTEIETPGLVGEREAARKRMEKKHDYQNRGCY